MTPAHHEPLRRYGFQMTPVAFAVAWGCYAVTRGELSIDDSIGECFDGGQWHDEHDWVWQEDSEGDTGVPGGVHDLSNWECANCGLADDGSRPAPEWRDYDD